MHGRVSEVRGDPTHDIRANVSRSDDLLISHTEVGQTLLRMIDEVIAWRGV